MNIKIVFSGVILTIFLIISFYINGIIGLLNYLLSIGTYIIIFYTLHIVWRKLSKKEIIDPIIYIKNFLFKISIFIVSIVSVIGVLSYLSNEIYKAKMPEYTITNGKKIVKFQAMVHIGSEKFYNDVLVNLKKFKEEGGIYFFEGVRPGSDENIKNFNNAIGIEFDGELYKNFSKLYGITFQNTSMFLGVVNNLDFNIDLSIDEIMDLYNKKKVSNNIEKKYSTPIDANKEIINRLSSMNEKELKILIYINQAILNLIIRSDNIQGAMSENFMNKELFDVILNERNKILVSEIQKSKYDKIYITYGLLHFKGVFEELKKQDPNWKIVETKYLFPID